MNKNSSIWISLLFVLLLAGCGSSDDDNFPSNDITQNAEGNISFQLLNTKMESCTVFEENENILFDLKIENNLDGDFVIKRDFKGGDLILNHHFFCVYKENGEEVDVPWSSYFCEDILKDEWIYPSHASWHILLPWYMSFQNTCIEDYSPFPFCKGADEGRDWPILKKGKYYVKFSVAYNRAFKRQYEDIAEQTFIIHFKIR